MADKDGVIYCKTCHGKKFGPKVRVLENVQVEALINNLTFRHLNRVMDMAVVPAC